MTRCRCTTRRAPAFRATTSALRPCTCAQPVMPGRASSRRRCDEVYLSTYFTGNGRGPTRLMSPLITDHSCGSSSRLLERSRRPSGVSRASSGSRLPSGWRSLVIVRNFGGVIGWESRPARAWRNTTGDPCARRTSRATTPITGNKTNPAMAARTMSAPRRMGLLNHGLVIFKRFDHMLPTMNCARRCRRGFASQAVADREGASAVNPREAFPADGVDCLRFRQFFSCSQLQLRKGAQL